MASDYETLLEAAKQKNWRPDQVASELTKLAAEHFGMHVGPTRNYIDELYDHLIEEGVLPLEARVGICVGWGLAYEVEYSDPGFKE